jgi:hypothetical protein
VWVDATGKRLRRGVTGPAKATVLDAVAELHEKLGSARTSSRKYAVNDAVAVWIEGGRLGRSDRTWNVCKELLALASGRHTALTNPLNASGSAPDRTAEWTCKPAQEQLFGLGLAVLKASALAAHIELSGVRWGRVCNVP